MKRAIVMGFIISTMLVAPFLVAGEPGEAQKKEKEELPMLMRMIRVKDAFSGEIRKPTPEELHRLMPENPLSRSSQDLVSKTLNHGAIKMDLAGRFKNVVVARMGPDGKMITACVTSESELRRFMETPVAKMKGVAHVR